MSEVVIIGGGLAGLVSSIRLKRAGFEVLLFEEKKYPFHRVCGEYISNEVRPFLEREGLFPEIHEPSSITNFKLTSVSGKVLAMPLDMGGFGVSRYTLDHWLYKLAQELGVKFIHERVIEVQYTMHDRFTIRTKSDKHYSPRIVIGAFGKRSFLDKSLKRNFVYRKSPYVGVKYHLHTKEAEPDYIELHNFSGGYCGISRVENNIYNLCYLSHRDSLKKLGSIDALEDAVLMKNPHLKRIYHHSSFLFDKPLVINEISFSKKESIHDHILMVGDTAGLITPLCGNGMAMAIHASKICTDILIANKNNFDRSLIEEAYKKQWNDLFKTRLRIGRNIQSLFGSKIVSEFTVSGGRAINPLAKFLMSQTHGDPF